MRRHACTLGLLLVLAGCGEDDGAAPATTTGTTAAAPATETGPAAVELTRTCRNQESEVTVRYPESWHTNEADGVPACTFFHPEPFTLPQAGEALDVAIRVDREPVPFDRVAGDSPARRDVTRSELTVAGRPAVRIDYESTGDALLPEGVPVTEVLVDLGGETLVATTSGVGPLDYERNVEVLDAIVSALSIGAG